MRDSNRGQKHCSFQSSEELAPKLAPFSADPDLLALVDAWPDLPAEVRQQIMDLVQQSAGRR